MIAKSLKAQSFAGCVRYVMKEDAELLKAEGVMAIDTKSIIDSFEFQRSGRSEIKSPAGHIPISFAPEDRDKITNDFMVKLAEEYMQKMGICNTQYIIVRHHDADQEHFHIVYNRINNDLKLISLNNDFRRNEMVTKQLKQRYGLTFGKDKMRVDQSKLRGREKDRYEIYSAVLVGLARSKNPAELQNILKTYGVEMQIKCRRGSDHVDGISFVKGDCRFKGSQVDRKFRYSAFVEIMEQNRVKAEAQQPRTLNGAPITDKQYDDLLRGEKVWIEGMTSKSGKMFNSYVYMAEDRMLYYRWSKAPSRLGGVEVTPEMRVALDDGKCIKINGMRDRQGVTHGDVYVRYSTDEDRLQFFRQNPEQEQEAQLRHEPSHSSGVLSLLDMPPSDYDQDEIDNAQMARNLQKIKKKQQKIKF